MSLCMFKSSCFKVGFIGVSLVCTFGFKLGVFVLGYMYAFYTAFCTAILAIQDFCQGLLILSGFSEV